jgi:hypothetical protein
MEHDLKAGDYLVFQLEAGFALLRLLAVDEDQSWHVTAFSEFFPSTDAAEEAVLSNSLTVATPHIALTNRAFESTQVARIAHRPLEETDLAVVDAWRNDPERHVSDRSVRLLLGLR